MNNSSNASWPAIYSPSLMVNEPGYNQQAKLEDVDAETVNYLFRYLPKIILEHLLLEKYKNLEKNTKSLERSKSLKNINHKRSETSCVKISHPKADSKETSSPTIHSFKNASILLADISGFTKLNERFSTQPNGAEQVTSHINAYFTTLLDIVDKHGGDVVKFAGDALIIFFGGSYSTAEEPKYFLEQADQPLPSLLEGSGKKCNAAQSNWKLRYFVLVEFRLMWFGAKPTVASPTSQNEIPLFKTSVVMVDPDTDMGLCVSSRPYGMSREYRFTFASLEDRDHWLVALEDLLIHAPEFSEAMMEKKKVEKKNKQRTFSGVFSLFASRGEDDSDPDDADEPVRNPTPHTHSALILYIS